MDSLVYSLIKSFPHSNIQPSIDFTMHLSFHSFICSLIYSMVSLSICFLVYNLTIQTVWFQPLAFSARAFMQVCMHSFSLTDVQYKKSVSNASQYLAKQSLWPFQNIFSSTILPRLLAISIMKHIRFRSWQKPEKGINLCLLLEGMFLF